MSVRLKTARLFALTAVFLTCVGATFSPARQSLVNDAIRLQDSVLTNEAFSSILRELARRDGIKWPETIADCASANANGFPDKISWLLARFERDRGYAVSSVRAWRKFNPFSSTTAATTPCVLTTKLNLWRLKRSPASVAGTLVHERTHSFGIVHAYGQRPAPNICDAAYVSGTTAEALLEPSLVQAESICPALCTILVERRIVATCNRQR